MRLEGVYDVLDVSCAEVNEPLLLAQTLLLFFIFWFISFVKCSSLKRKENLSHEKARCEFLLSRFANGAQTRIRERPIHKRKVD